MYFHSFHNSSQNWCYISVMLESDLISLILRRGNLDWLDHNRLWELCRQLGQEVLVVCNAAANLGELHHLVRKAKGLGVDKHVLKQNLACFQRTGHLLWSLQ